MNLNKVPGYLASKITFHLMCRQAVTGFPFDVEKAKEVLAAIGKEMKEIEWEVEPQLPPRPLKKSEQNEFTFPKKPFKADGTLSSHGQKFLEKHGLVLIGVDHVQWDGKLERIVGGKQLTATATMTLSNQEDIKNFLLESGWNPSLWNYKRDERGKPARDEKGKLIKTSPKFQENGRLCPNLEEMSGDLVRPIVRWLSLRNRESVINGWLSHERLQRDGRLPAESSGITNTHRQKHSIICNLPKAEEGIVYGKEVRSLFTAPPGMVLVGYDASALEARIEAHYTKRYEGGEDYARTLIEEDVHLNTVKGVWPEKVAHVIGTERWNKDDPGVKPWRSKAKNIRYGIGYGAQPPKIASMLGISTGEAEVIVDRFWEASKPLALLREKLVRYWETVGKKQWLVGLDGRLIPTRSAHSIINTLFQSGGAIVMDYSGIFMDKWLGGLKLDEDGYPCYKYKGEHIYRLAYYHDEYVWACSASIAQEIGNMGVRSIEKAGEYLKLNVPLTGDFSIGPNWASIH